MGVEYRHYLIPENPSFVPSSGVIKRIDIMLEKWKLKAGNPKVYNLSADGLSVFIDFISDVEEALGCKVIEVGAIG